MIDSVGPWTERKFELIRAYADAYSKILTRAKCKTRPFSHVYIDAFASAGVARSRTSGEIVLGSALRVLSVQPPFAAYHFVERDTERATFLSQLVRDSPDVAVINGDANDIVPALLERIRYDRYERALVFLDPYRLDNLRWPTIEACVKNAAVDLLLHFPTMDAERNVLLTDSAKVRPAQAEKLSRYLGGDEWFNTVYETATDVLPFDDLPPLVTKVGGIMNYVRRRLLEAGATYVSDPIPMRNSIEQVVYHLAFAVHHGTAERVARHVSNRFRT